MNWRPGIDTGSNDYYGFEQCEPGYWLGGHSVLGIPLHVEVIELRRDPKTMTALNPRFQGRIDTWLEGNEGEKPRLYYEGRRRFFVAVSVYAE